MSDSDTTQAEVADAEEPPKPRKSKGPWWKRILRWVRNLVLLVLALIGLALVALQFDAVKDLVKTQVLSALNGSLAGEIQVDRLEGSIISDVSLVGVTIRDPDGQVALSADRIDVDIDPLDLFALFDQTVRLRAIVVSGLDMNLLDDEDRVMLGRAFAPASPSEPEPEQPEEDTGPGWRVELEAIGVIDSRVEDLPGGMVVENLQIGTELTQGAEGLRWGYLSVQGAVRNGPVDSIWVVSRGELAGSALRLESLEVAAGPHSLAASGAITDLETGAMDVDLHILQLDLDALAKRVDGLDVAGHVSLQGSVEGAISGADVKLALSGSAGLLRIEGRAGVTDAGPVADLRLLGWNLAPGAVLPSAGIPVTASLDGLVTIKGDPTTDGDANVGLTLYDITGHKTLPPKVVVEGSMVAGNLRAGVTAEDIDLSVDGRVPGPLVAWVDVQRQDIGAWADLAGVSGLGGQLHGLSGGAEIDLDAGPAVAGQLTLSAGALQVELAPEPVAVTDVTSDVQLVWAGEGLPAGDLTLRVDGARFGDRKAGRITAKLKADPAAGGTRVVGEVVARNVAAPEGRADHVEVPVDVVLSAEQPIPEGDVTVRATSVAAAGISATSVRADLDVQPDDGGIAASGTVATDGFAVGRDVRVSSARGKVSAAVSGDGRIDGEVELTAQKVVAGGVTVTDATVRGTARGTPAQGIAIDGGVVASRVRPSEDLALSDVRVGAGLTVGNGFPRGEVSFETGEVDSWGVTIPKLIGRAQLASGGTIAASVQGTGDVERAVEATVKLPIGGRDSLVVELERLRLAGGGHGIAAEPATISIGRSGSIRVPAPGLRLKEVGGDGRIEVVGSLSGSRRAGKLDIEVASLDVAGWLAEVKRLIGLPLPEKIPVRGLVDVDMVVSGTSRRPEIHIAKLQIDEGRAADITGLGVDLTADYDDGQLTIDGRATWADLRAEDTKPAVVKFDKVRMPMRLSLLPFSFELGSVRGMAGEVVAEGLAFPRLSPWLPEPERKPERVGGVLTATVNLEGMDSEVPKIRVDLSAKELVWGPMDARDIEGQVLLSGERSVVQLSVGRSGAPPQIGLDVAAGLALAGTLRDALDEGIRGGNATDKLLSEVRKTRNASVFGGMLVRGVRLGEFPFVPKELRETVVTVAQGRLGADAEAPLALVGKVGAPRLVGLVAVDGVKAGRHELGGELMFEDQGEGTVPRMLLRANDRIVAEGSWRIPNVVAMLVDGKDPVTVLDDPKLRLDILTPAVSAEVIGAFVPDVRSILDQWLPSARTTLAVSVRGTDHGPEGTVWLDTERRARTSTESLFRGVSVTAMLRPDESQVVVSADQGSDGGILGIEAKLAMGSRDLLAGEDPSGAKLHASLASSGVRLDKLPAVLAGVFSNTRGALDADLQVTGTPRDPHMEGFVDLRFDEVTVQPIGLTRKDLAFGLWVRDRKLQLCEAPESAIPVTERGECRSVRLEAGEGRFLKLELAVTMAELDPEKMDVAGLVESHDFDLLRTPDMKANVDAELKLSGSVADTKVAGDVRVNEGLIMPQLGGGDIHTVGLPRDVRFMKADALEGSLARAARKQQQATPLLMEGSLPVELAVKVDIPTGKVRVKNKFVDTRPHTKGSPLVITTQRGRLSMDGRIWIDNGYVNLYERRFEFTEDSYVEFTGDIRNDPRLHIRAEYDISDVDLSALGTQIPDQPKVIIEVNGNINNIKVEDPKSTPAMTKSQIMNVIVFGTLPTSDTTSADLSQQRIAETLLSFLGFTDKLRESFGPLVDEITFVPTGEAVKLNVGKQITDDLWFYYQLNLGADEDENENEARLEYRLGRRLHIDARYGDAMKGKVDLTYRYRW